MPSSNIATHFSECFQFISDAISGGGRVLVHCLAGISRSASVVIAYVMATKGMTLLRASEYVRARRHWINPNTGFMNQLKRFEAQLASTRV